MHLNVCIYINTCIITEQKNNTSKVQHINTDVKKSKIYIFKLKIQRTSVFRIEKQKTNVVKHELDHVCNKDGL